MVLLVGTPSIMFAKKKYKCRPRPCRRRPSSSSPLLIVIWLLLRLGEPGDTAVMSLPMNAKFAIISFASHSKRSSSSNSHDSNRNNHHGTRSSTTTGSNPTTWGGPFPIMPSSTFFSLAKSQFELLINSIHYPSSSMKDETKKRRRSSSSKIKSIALYLPQENPKNGQLEFMPSIVYPSHPRSERIFIASDAQSGLAPTIPPTLTQLPGFSHASALLPAYPFTGAPSSFVEGRGEAGSSSLSSSGTVGVPEEVFCDVRIRPKGRQHQQQRQQEQQHSTSPSTVLSLPLFSGPQTIGILLVWGSGGDVDTMQHHTAATAIWTEQDKNQISRVGETLALALCMDSDRFQNRIRSEKIRVAMADNLHQVKNPVQALRTFTKLLQRSLATRDNGGGGGTNVELARLVDDIVIQSERVVDLLHPFDSILNSMEEDSDRKKLNSYQRLLAPMEMKRSDLVLRHGSATMTTATTAATTNTGLQSDKNKINLPNETPYLALLSNTTLGDSPREEENDNQVENIVKLEMAFVPDVLGNVFSSSKRMAEDLGIDMQIIGNESSNDLPGVFINPKLLQEAVINVLDNAMKYISYGMDGVQGVVNTNPKIRVSILSNTVENNKKPAGVTILVEDNGPGIPTNEIQSIFQRGYRGEYTSFHTDGSGIGLHISKDMIYKMGGSLEILVDKQSKKKRYLHGTVVRFVLYRKPNNISYTKNNVV